MFVRMAAHIRHLQPQGPGYTGRFFGREYVYADYDGFQYWTMGAPLPATIILNRCRKVAGT